MTNALAPTEPTTLDRATIAKVLLSGDLEKLTDEQRMAYVTRVCDNLGLDPLTQPFAFLKLSGRLVMYAKKDATEQLRKLHGVSITAVTSQRIEDVFVVTANAQDRAGRTDAATGAVAVGTLKGDALANALMKAETKAKRRVTLSICGLGMLDETEVETIPQAYVVEAPKLQAALPPIPPFACRVLNVEPKRKGAFEWADVTYVTDAGEEKIAVAKMGMVALLESFAQNNVLCDLTITTNSKGKAEIEEARRWSDTPEQPSLIPEEPIL